MQRVNAGIRKSTFVKTFGHVPLHPVAGKVIDMDFVIRSIHAN